MKSIRAKLTVFCICLVGLCLAGTGLALRARVQANLVDEIDRQLEAEVASVRAGEIGTFEDEHERLAIDPNHAIVGEKRIVHKPGSAASSTMVKVLRDGSDEIQARIDDSLPQLIPVRGQAGMLQMLKPQDPAGFEAAKSGRRLFHDFVQGSAKKRSLSTPEYRSGRMVAVAQAVRALAPAQAQMADLDRGLEMMIPLAIVVAALGGSLMVGSTMRPLRRLIESARALQPQSSDSRLPVQGQDEFAALAIAFNEAFDRQRRAMDQLERFTGDAGHELKTPLGAIKGSTSYLLHMADLPSDCRKSVAVMDRCADRMAKLIDDLLLLAREDGRTSTLRPSTVSLEESIDEALEQVPACRQIAVSVSCEPNAHAWADSAAIERIVVNLLLNAYTYARSKVCLSAGIRDGNAFLSVQDDGEGIPPEHLQRLGERFYRPDTSRSRQQGGTGLGLAIVKALCQAQNGRLEIDSTVGVGSNFTVVLPAKRATDSC
ncbi:MAG TPA: HAMP domain-containing sensor histidine kinase [Fimbriimonas sp.]|nr:HAMP domain-containing sensor histidine kinase [Fimbriimonas sp.]